MGHSIKDVRLERRGERVLDGIVGSGSLVLRRIGSGRAGEVAAHRYLDNAGVTPEAILATAGRRTARAAEGRRVLAVQDTTEVNFSGADRGRTGLGPAGDGKARGFFTHPLLVVDADQEAVLGIAGASIWTRDDEPSAHRRSRPLEDKESGRWIEGATAAGGLVGIARQVVVVADREADIYQHFARRPAGVDLIVRVRHNRKLTDSSALYAAAKSFAAGFERAVKVPPRGPGDKGRVARVGIRFGEVALARPDSADARKDPESLTLRLVEIIETEPPRGVKPLCWRLLTTLAVDSIEAAEEVARLYRLRWRIEQLFRTLKSDGLKLEDSQIEAAARLFKLAALALVAAARVLQLVDARDGSPRPATDLIEASLIEPVAAIAASLEGATRRQRNPHAKGSLAWLAWVAGRLGGWNCYYKPPGPKTMAGGWQRLEAMLEGFAIAERFRHV